MKEKNIDKVDPGKDKLSEEEQIAELIGDTSVGIEVDTSRPGWQELNLETDIGMDSMDMVELAMDVEDHFELEHSTSLEDEIERAATIHAVADLVRKELSRQRAQDCSMEGNT